MNPLTSLQPPIVQRLPQLLTEIAQGLILVPRFQRRYLWTVEQRVELLRSIQSGLPIGSVMLWRTARQELLRSPLHTLLPNVPPPDAQPPYRQYLLDGHQRLGTLYRALAPGLLQTLEPGTLSLEEQDERGDPDDWPIYFDLEASTFELVPLHRRDNLPLTLFPLDKLLDPLAVFEHQQRIFQHLPDQRQLAYRIEHLANRFKDYQLPIQLLASEDLEIVTTTFQRINSAGTSLTEVDMLAALAWGRDLDLQHRIDTLQQDLADLGWQDIEPRQILQTLKGIADLPTLTRKTPEDLRDRLLEHPEDFEKATQALRAAVVFLQKTCHIPGPKLLPYAIQLPALAALIHHNPTIPSKDLEEGLRRWLWWTSHTGWFSITNDSRVRQSFDILDVETAEEAALENALQGLSLADPLPLHARSVRARCWAVRLADLTPLDLDGSAIPAGALLAAQGPGVLTTWQRERSRTISNVLLLNPTTAKFFLKAVQEAPETISDAVLTSHAFSPEAAEALRRGAAAEALELRRQRLVELRRTFLLDLWTS